MFGFVTKRQLEQHREELAAQLREMKRLQEEIAYEWASWFNKFRSLYARLLKRESDAAKDAPQPTNGDEPGEEPPAQPPARFSTAHLARRFRGF